MPRTMARRRDQLREALRPWWMKLSVLVLIMMASGAVAGFRMNVSGSLPIGFYKAVGDASALKRGSIVVVCLPAPWNRFARERKILGPGRCAGGTYGLGKRVIAIEGDAVTLSPDGVAVGTRVFLSKRQDLDRLGRPFPHHPLGTYTLTAGEVWLYSCHPSAFDSRYFGPVTRSSITMMVEPLLVASDRCNAQ